ncbi:TPA: DUF4236 domain-containing protein [Legionella pneumophila]|nr:DUF4236 domain-containing protein [Legionella pneumophila]HBD9320254.1 DUF4236 domain-containing protein [Legionella pneumophila]HBD9332961.1 DUF4236 domain-containing protein [Legionella pneumophila]
MALRFQRRITLIPGVRLNIGKKGGSLSFGPRGASINVGKNGLFANIGLPGTGLSIRNRLDSNNKQSSSLGSDTPESIKVVLRVDDLGTLLFETDAGLTLPPNLVKRLKAEQPEIIYQALKQGAEQINKNIDELMSLHYTTPSPYQTKPVYPRLTLPYPKKPVTKTVSFWHKLLGKASIIEQENNQKLSFYEQAITHWDKIQKEEDEAENYFNTIIEQAMGGDLLAMEKVLAYTLSDLKWAKDTQVSYDFKDQSTLYLDVDLPDLIDMPKKYAEIPSRGYKLLIKERSETQSRKDFCHLVHAILFRITGEIFAALPALKKIILSGYVQHNNVATGVIEDMYIISVEIELSKWVEINFNQLSTVNPVSALERFNIRKNMDRVSNFCQIEPL